MFLSTIGPNEVKFHMELLLDNIKAILFGLHGEVGRHARMIW